MTRRLDANLRPSALSVLPAVGLLACLTFVVVRGVRDPRPSPATISKLDTQLQAHCDTTAVPHDGADDAWLDISFPGHHDPNPMSVVPNRRAAIAGAGARRVMRLDAAEWSAFEARMSRFGVMTRKSRPSYGHGGVVVSARLDGVQRTLCLPDGADVRDLVHAIDDLGASPWSPPPVSGVPAAWPPDDGGPLCRSFAAGTAARTVSVNERCTSALGDPATLVRVTVDPSGEALFDYDWRGRLAWRLAAVAPSERDLPSCDATAWQQEVCTHPSTFR